MPQIVTIGSGGDYSTVASWVASSDYSTDWGVGNKATGQITGKITETVTINTAVTPNGALLTAFPGEEYDGTNSATCAGLTSNGITLALRDNGLEVSNIFIETTVNMIALRLGAFEAVDSDVHDIGVKSGLTGNDSNAIETYSAAAFTGNLERVAVEGSGGYGIWLRNDATGTLDHITIVGACANGSGFRHGFLASGASTVVTNTLVLLAATASGSALAFSGTFNASSDFNAGDDTSAPGGNSLDNRTTADLANFPTDVRTALASALATAGSGGTFIGFDLEDSGGLSASITETGPSFSESIASTITSLVIEVSISESGPSFTESISATIIPAPGLVVTITEQGPSFVENSSVSVLKDITVAITESGPSFTDFIAVTLPIFITVNPRNTVKVKRMSNNVTIKRKSNTIRVR